MLLQTDVTDLIMSQRETQATMAQLSEEKKRAEALLQVRRSGRRRS